jgi:hypothetical protein
MSCPECPVCEIKLNGIYQSRADPQIAIWNCNKCGYLQVQSNNDVDVRRFPID